MEEGAYPGKPRKDLMGLSTRFPRVTFEQWPTRAVLVAKPPVVYAVPLSLMATE